MKDINWTTEQFQAIHATGSSILVSAAAGAGKTTVLIARIMEQILIPENHTDITDYLIITYTRAAADELKNKIMKEISIRCAEEPDNLHLQRQLLLCKKAKINTIHGICAEWLREYAQLAGVSPDFRIAEEEECEELKETVLQRVLENAYSKAANHPAYLSVFDLMVTSAGDGELQKAVMEIYEKLRSHPNPENWIIEQMTAVKLANITDAADTVWGREILEYVQSFSDTCLSLSRQLFEESRGSEFTSKFRDNAEEIYLRFKRLSESLSEGWDSVRTAINFSFPRLSSSKKTDCTELILLKNICSILLKRIQPFFTASSDDLLEEMKTVGSQAQGLYELVLEFDKAYSLEKQNRGILDFSDLEHKTAQLVFDFTVNKPTSAAKDISERYHEIMIDEYQDVNEIQELILTSVSSQENNLFMVGDVKQSIYRFRLADPSIFLKKYYSYADYSEDSNVPSRVLLPQNFRSSNEIITGINFIFKKIMSKSIGDLEYGPNEELKFGRRDSINVGGNISFHFSFSPSMNADEIRQQEADSIARQILEMVTKGECISDNGTLRPLTYQDFAILLRNAKQRTSIYTDALTKYGIPWNSEQGEDLLACREVSLILHYLDIIDNPNQDIALLDVLHSPFVGLSYDELAEMRASFDTGPLFQALVQFSQTNAKANSFLEKLVHYRELSPGLSSDRILVLLYEDLDAATVLKACGYFHAEEHLFSLLQYAVSYESNGFQGLFRFQNHIAYRRKNGGIITDPGTGGHGVHLMTIHKSKGLEFPIVILADTAASLNKSDSQKTVLFHKELGLGLEARDNEKKVKYKTLARIAIQNRLNSEMLSEEIRVLYVALTRAKDKLLIYSSVSTLKHYSDIQKMGDFSLNPLILSGMTSTSQWIFSALNNAISFPELNENCQNFSLESSPWIIQFESHLHDESEEIMQTALNAENPPCDRMVQDSEFSMPVFITYPHSRSIDIPAKVTATTLKSNNHSEIDDGSILFPSERVLRKPDFAKKSNTLSGSEKGTALHLAMQHLHYENCTDIKSLNREIEILVKKCFLSERQAAAIDRNKILTLFHSETGKLLLAQEKLRREFKFSLLLSANELEVADEEEQVLFQGIIDCWFEESDGITIVDFKTDRITGSNFEEKINVYSRQINLYATALERITGNHVKAGIIYFFDNGHSVNVVKKDKI